MIGVREHRVKAFCDWLDTIPPHPPFRQHRAVRFYADLTQAEFDAARVELRRRGASAAAEADALERALEDRQSGRLKMIDAGVADISELAGDLGGPEDWLTSAIAHLKAATSCRVAGSVDVSVAALHLVLNHVEHLELQLGLHNPPGGEAA